MAIESITSRKPDLPSIKTTPKNGPDNSKPITNNDVTQSDTVAITSTALDIQKTLEAPQGAAIDVDRVASVKKSIADGSYAINAENIAKKMIQFEKSFNGDSN